MCQLDSSAEIHSASWYPRIIYCKEENKEEINKTEEIQGTKIRQRIRKEKNTQE